MNIVLYSTWERTALIHNLSCKSLIQLKFEGTTSSCCLQECIYLAYPLSFFQTFPVKTSRYSSKILSLFLKLKKKCLKHYNEEEIPGEQQTKEYRKLVKGVGRSHLSRRIYSGEMIDNAIYLFYIQSDIMATYKLAVSVSIQIVSLCYL